MLALLLALLSPPIALAPSVTISGRVVRVVGGDTISCPGTMVVLHRVSSRRQGPVDSIPSQADGSFRFRVTPDSGDIYLVSAKWGGVEYFGQPFTSAVLSVDRKTVVVVSDTSSSAAIAVTQRQLVIVAPGGDGAREVIDVITMLNPSGMTRVPSGPLRTTWRLVLPPRVAAMHLDDSDFATDAFQQLGDTLFLLAPIPPGEHVIYLSYRLPPGTTRLVLPASDRQDSVSVMAGEGKLAMAPPFAMVETKEIEGKTFSHWEGSIAAKDSAVVNLPGDGKAPNWLLPALVGLLGLGLIGGGSVALSKRRSQLVPAAAPRSTISRDQLLDRIVQLDALNAGGQQAVGNAAWEAYLKERQELKSKLKEEVGHQIQ